MKIWIFALFLFSSHVSAMNIYGGGSIGLGQGSYSFDSKVAVFDTHKYSADLGLHFNFNEDFGFLIGSEMGVEKGSNKDSGQNYMESYEKKFLTFKAGFSIGQLSLGAGSSSTDINIQSIGTFTGYIKADYEGSLPIYFLGYSTSPRKSEQNLRTQIEVQHTQGKLKDLQVKDTSVSVKILLFLDVF